MLLTIDIGNTNITAGAFVASDSSDAGRRGALHFSARLATDKYRTKDQYAIELMDIFRLYGVSPKSITGSVISSVVPELTTPIANAVLQITTRAPLILGPGTKTGLNILIDNPAQVGADLVAGAVAAIDLYPLPCLVIDLGTATKISVIDKNGAFRGCSISAGIAISLDALSSRTSQLPTISLDTPEHAIGTNTIDSMRAGTVFGTAAMLDGMCSLIEEELGEKVETIVATGGLSADIIKSCKRNMIYNGELTLHGLRSIYNRNRKKC